MRRPRCRTSFADVRFAAILGLTAILQSDIARAGYAEDIGLTALRAELGAAIPTGIGVGVSQIEAGGSPPNLSYMPDITSAEFTGKTITAKSGASTVSGHANAVASYYYGRLSSLAPGVTTVDVYEASNWLLAEC